MIALAKRKSHETGRTIGVYVETKHPTYHQSIGLALLTPAGLAEVATYADGIGPWKPYIQSWAGSALLPPTSVVEDAHRAGLVVHPFTFRNEASRMAPAFGGNAVAEYLHFFELGVDGAFSDFADTAVAARAMFRLATGPPYAECLLDERRCRAEPDWPPSTTRVAEPRRVSKRRPARPI